MCSVVGYIGNALSRSFILEGLSRLEYRGYDSAGFACLDKQQGDLVYAKAEGALHNLVATLEKQPIDGFSGIGHTRWATHGALSVENAHPQLDCQKNISIVHNGIIENHDTLRKNLSAEGHLFHSQTDTEIIAHQLESSLQQHSLVTDAIIDITKRIEGAYAFIALMRNYADVMILVRKRSPLCIGIGDGEMFVASDMLAFAGKTNKVVFLPDESFALVFKDHIEQYRFDGTPLPAHIQTMEIKWDSRGKNEHEHFMLKEIYEQKGAIQATVESLHANHDQIWAQMGVDSFSVARLESINLLGCGGSWHAGAIAHYFFEKVCMIPAHLHLASEFRYDTFFPNANSIYVAISQSGETADMLESVRLLNTMDMHTVALVNVSSSTLVRESNGFIITQAGPEVAVASTKAFSTQLVTLYWLAHRIALEKNIISAQKMIAAEHELIMAAEILENTLENYKIEIIQTLAKKYASYHKMIVLGRHVSFPFSLEAALKLKEIAYIFTSAYPAGELKHGPLALIDDETPVIAFSHLDPVVYQKLVSNIQEVKARNGHIIAFAFEGQDQLIEIADTCFIFPRINPLLGPLCMTGLMQFFFYAIAKELGRPIDKPRNLAKSVTVE